jgi:phenylalanyl-tRNA synthetase beta chain
MTIKADVVEEVARIYGYHNLPSVLMSAAIPTSAPKNTNFTVEEKIKTFLSILGWQELYTYSLVNQALALQTPFSVKEHLKLSNPLTEDKVYLRRSLIPSLQEVMDQSKRTHLSIFEIANVYHPQERELPQETLLLGIVSTKDYRTVRGEIEALAAHLHIAHVSFVPSKEDDQVATVLFNSDEVGAVRTNQGRTVSEITIHGLISHAQSHPTYSPPPKTAQIFEDLTFTTPEKTPIGEMIAAMAGSDSKITMVTLKGLYKQNATFSITYHDPEKNIDGIEIEPIRKKLVEIARTQFSAQLVGTLE